MFLLCDAQNTSPPGLGKKSKYFFFFYLNLHLHARNHSLVYNIYIVCWYSTKANYSLNVYVLADVIKFSSDQIQMFLRWHLTDICMRNLESTGDSLEPDSFGRSQDNTFLRTGHLLQYWTVSSQDYKKCQINLSCAFK